MEVFTQFSSDLDDATKEQLAYGAGLMELLKQPLAQPLSMPQQVITLWAATHKAFLEYPISKVKSVQAELLKYFDELHPEIIKEIETTKTLTDETADKIMAVVAEFKKSN
jgi:F-type H+-transporting ATPase subunit alpha